MPRGTKLSEVDIAIIKTLHKRGVSNRKIASEIDRSETVVRHYLSNPSNYGQKKRSGRKSSISKRQQNVIFKKATEEMMSCSQIKADMKLAVSRERIRQIIKKDNRAIYAKMLKKTSSY